MSVENVLVLLIITLIGVLFAAFIRRSSKSKHKRGVQYHIIKGTEELNDNNLKRQDLSKEISEPWCFFRPDKMFSEEITSKLDYIDHGTVREIIYEHYPEDPSISFGSLPTILSPMFWEAISGRKQSEISSFKYQGNPISKSKYIRYMKTWNYQRDIFKVYLTDIDLYIRTLNRNYVNFVLNNNQIINDINRRLTAMQTFKDSIRRREWPKLLLIVSEIPITELDHSFTITKHMLISLYRGEELESHKGHFYYHPKRSDFLEEAWAKKWLLSIKYGQERENWPSEIRETYDIVKYEDECRVFNTNSIETIKRNLESLLAKYR